MILEILDGWGNLAVAEFLPLRAFLAFFCKIFTPGERTEAQMDRLEREPLSVCQYQIGFFPVYPDSRRFDITGFFCFMII